MLKWLKSLFSGPVFTGQDKAAEDPACYEPVGELRHVAILGGHDVDPQSRIKAAAAEYRRISLEAGVAADFAAGTGLSKQQRKDITMNAMLEAAGRVARKHGLPDTMETTIAIVNEAWGGKI